MDFKDWKWMLGSVHRFDFLTTLDFYLQNFSLEFYLHEEQIFCDHDHDHDHFIVTTVIMTMVLIMVMTMVLIMIMTMVMAMVMTMVTTMGMTTVMTVCMIRVMLL